MNSYRCDSGDTRRAKKGELVTTKMVISDLEEPRSEISRQRHREGKVDLLSIMGCVCGEISEPQAEVNIITSSIFSVDPKADHVPTLRKNEPRERKGVACTAEKRNDAIRFLEDEMPGEDSEFTAGEAAHSQSTEELTRQTQAQLGLRDAGTY